MSAAILCENDGSITSITLNRPEAGNRITNEMVRTLAGMIDAAAGAQAIVLRAAGTNFCMGRELPPGARDAATALAARAVHAEPILALAEAFGRASAPVIGIVHGKVIGGGCAVAGLCDVTIAADDATFQLPEMQHGIPPCLAMAALAKRMPRKALLHFVYAGDVMTAPEALASGLVSKVVASAELEAAAAALIAKLAGYARPAVHAVKQFMRSAADLDGAAVADLAGNLLAAVVSSARH